ncbi:MAG: Ig-like domain-containing protein, partial [Parvularculaceae bacterium]
MSIDYGARTPFSNLDFGDLVDVARANAKRGRAKAGGRRSARERLVQASMLAPLLATEGCFTIGGGKDTPLTDTPGDHGSNSGGAAPPPDAIIAADDDNFYTAVDSEVMIATEDLIENDALPLGATAEVVRVFGASHGTVMLHDGVIHFSPDAGFSGMATFTYEVRDSKGNLSRAEVEVQVGGKPPTPDDTGSGVHDHDHSGGMVHPD